MLSRPAVAVALFVSMCSVNAAAPTNAAGEYSKHFGALAKLSIAVAQAMPPDHNSFRPHSESMTFGELMSHIASTNYQFCAGLNDSNPPALPSPTETKPVSSSFSAIPSTTALA